jgi:rhodanese-related sulfurtransferase
VVQSITPKQAHELITKGEVDVVDVRDAGEWAGGHLPSARHVPLERLRSNPKASIDHDGVLFVCAAGMRSETAARLAASQGFTRVLILPCGSRGWVKEGLPLVVDELKVAV